MATQGGKVHSADKSYCVFDGDADNVNNDIGGDNYLSSIANQISIAQTISSLVRTLKGGVTIFFPPHPTSRGSGPDVGGRAGLTPTSVLSLPFLCKPCPGGHSDSHCFSLGLKPPHVQFSMSRSHVAPTLPVPLHHHHSPP